MKQCLKMEAWKKPLSAQLLKEVAGPSRLNRQDFHIFYFRQPGVRPAEPYSEKNALIRRGGLNIVSQIIH